MKILSNLLKSLKKRESTESNEKEIRKERRRTPRSRNFKIPPQIKENLQFYLEQMEKAYKSKPENGSLKINLRHSRDWVNEH